MSVKRGWPNRLWSVGKLFRLGIPAPRKSGQMFVGIFVPAIMTGIIAFGMGGLGAGSFLRPADGSGLEGVDLDGLGSEVRSNAGFATDSSVDRSMATAVEASAGFMIDASAQDDSELDTRNEALSTSPLRQRTRSRIEPVVLGAAMEVAIGLPRE